jgi:hypothetical protein
MRIGRVAKSRRLLLNFAEIMNNEVEELKTSYQLAIIKMWIYMQIVAINKFLLQGQGRTSPPLSPRCCGSRVQLRQICYAANFEPSSLTWSLLFVLSLYDFL